jgi:high affinity Mn2+ porin
MMLRTDRIVQIVLLCTLWLAQPAVAQTSGSEEPRDASPETAMFTHSDTSAWWISGQLNLIGQAHAPFRSPYEGTNSLRAVRERALSRVLTLYTGLRLGHGWEVLFDAESAAGTGLSDAFGLGGFTDLDVVRNPSLGSAPYLARLMIRKVIALSSEQVTVTRTPLALATRLPARRLEIRAGKLGLVDFFDVNGVGGDSHLQFTNWTIDNTGAYDYAADTRGYTYGVMAEYDAPRWSLRGAEALMPTTANGIVLDWHVARARGENVELELRPTPALIVRLLGYANHANMGRYDEAIQAFRNGLDPTPNIEAHRRQGRIKYGSVGNAEYTTSAGVRLFARAGWNEGRNESFAYTEVDNTAVTGMDVTGGRWKRPGDRVGTAFASNGLSADHREYLRLGGLGFLLGDGGLNYGREEILESYYTAHLWRGVFASAGLQYIRHPGYNQDRGPVLVETGRVHVDF